MVRSVFRPIRLREWFPADDALTAIIARLCILREDFALELRGISAEGLGELDKHSTAWRKLYFFRRSILTLREIDCAINVNLIYDQGFRELLSKQTPSDQEEFQRITQKIKEAQPLVKELRDSLGGHVWDKCVEKAIEDIQPDRIGFLDAGQVIGDTHYKFAGELVLEMMAPGLSDEQRMEKIETDMRTVANLSDTLPEIDAIVTWYVDRQLAR